MSYQEFYEWFEYYNKEPFLSDRIEIQLATIGMQIASFGSSKGKKPKHEDYMISNKNKKKKQATNQEIIAMFSQIGNVKDK